MTDVANPDTVYARRLVELCRLLREGKISDLRENRDMPLKSADGVYLGMVRVWFRYMVEGEGIHWELEPGQTTLAAALVKAVHPGFTVTEVTA